MQLPLEDNYEDVLGKAMRGRGLTPEQLAGKAGITVEQTRAVLGGAFEAETARRLARELELGPERVVALGEKTYHPDPVSVEPGVLQFNTPFDDMTVNAYLVWDPATRDAAVFDTGTDVSDLLEAARARELKIVAIYLTHAHGDHIYDLDRLMEKTKVPAFAPVAEPVDGAMPFEPGTEFEIGGIKVRTRLTWGHARGGVTYMIDGLEKPVAICGDAMFAGSMGGGMISYADALRTNREEILSLPGETVLCPGHGPMTTVTEQKKANPFFPERKQGGV